MILTVEIGSEVGGGGAVQTYALQLARQLMERGVESGLCVAARQRGLDSRRRLCGDIAALAVRRRSPVLAPVRLILEGESSLLCRARSLGVEEALAPEFAALPFPGAALTLHLGPLPARRAGWSQVRGTLPPGFDALDQILTALGRSPLPAEEGRA